MRWWCLVAAVCTGCSFDVIGTTVGGSDPGATTPGGSPTSSIPDPPDAATAPPTSDPTPPPPPMPPVADMAVQRIGTACMSNAQCDPGLTCAQTFNVGLSRVDIPGGYCTHDCTNAACPPNSYCGTFSFGKFCISSCPPDPCRKDYKCCNNSNKKACLPDDLCSN